jgi:hypothetical protein
MKFTMALGVLASLPLGFAFAFGGVACIDALEADGTIQGLQGGSTLDSAEELTPQKPAGACTDAGTPGNPCALASICCGAEQGAEICTFNGMASGTCTVPKPLGTATTWTALYADYFGGTGRAACSGDGQCHGAATQAGVSPSGGYVCPPDDKDGCYTSLTSQTAALISPGLSFQNDALYQYLRKPTSLAGTTLNNMPKTPTEVYTFSAKDLDRIAAWVAAGAKND